MNTIIKKYTPVRLISGPSLMKACLLITGLLPLGTSLAAPITFNTALPVSEGQFIARSLLVFDKKSTSDITSEQLNLVSVLGYGVNSKLTVFGVLPNSWVKRDENGLTRRDHSIGDAEFFARYEVLRIDKPGATKRIAPFIGVRLPTGERGLTSDGTNDVFAGVTFTSASSKYNLEAQVRYDRNGHDTTFNTFDQSSRFDQGDSISTDISWQKRVLPNKIKSDTKAFWFAVLEANLSYSQHNKIDGNSVNDSGGFVASVSPGLQYSTRRWIGEIALRVPVIKNVNGSALEPDYTLFTGVRVKF